jgi:hypothetical protein
MQNANANENADGNATKKHNQKTQSKNANANENATKKCNQKT